MKKAMFQIGLKKFLWLKKLKTLFCGHILLVIKENQKGGRIEKAIKRKGNKLYVEWKGCDSSFGLIKKL